LLPPGSAWHDRIAIVGGGVDLHQWPLRPLWRILRLMGRPTGGKLVRVLAGAVLLVVSFSAFGQLVGSWRPTREAAPERRKALERQLEGLHRRIGAREADMRRQDALRDRRPSIQELRLLYGERDSLAAELRAK
jgi:hypothetical protein